MAIEDAVILAHTLKNSDSLSGALGADERSRVAKTARIVETSRRLGKICSASREIFSRLVSAEA